MEINGVKYPLYKELVLSEPKLRKDGPNKGMYWAYICDEYGDYEHNHQRASIGLLTLAEVRLLKDSV